MSKCSNLRCLERLFNSFHSVKIFVAERHDATEMSRLLQLILGCAVNCADKQLYIEAIMKMGEREQHIVMQVWSV